MFDRVNIRQHLSSVPLIAGWILAGVAIVGAICSGSKSGLHLFEVDGIRLIGTRSWKVLIPIAIGAIWFARRRGSELSHTACVVFASTAALFLFFIGDVFDRRFSFLLSNWDRLDLLLIGLTATVIVGMTAGQEERTRFRMLALGFAALILLLMQAYVEASGGRLLFSDDHPSFVYRMQLLQSEFPRIPFYNTDWNLGVLSRDFFASGILNVFLLSYPLLFLFDLDLTQIADATVYFRSLLLICYVVLPPLGVFLTVRLLGGNRIAGLVGGLAFTGFSMSYFEWLLRYGTLGFCFSVAMFPLAFACLLRMFADPADRSDHYPQPAFRRYSSRSLFLFAATVIIVSLCAMWSLSAIAFAGFALVPFVDRKSFFQKTRILLLALFVAVFFLINGPWMATFIKESQVATFVGGAALPGTHNLKRVGGEDTDPGLIPGGVRLLRQNLVRTNPLVLCFGFVGVLVLHKRYRTPIIGSLVTLFTAALFTEWKPQLELHRIILFAFALLAALTGVGIEYARTIYRVRTPRLFHVVSILLFGYLLLGPLNAAGVLRNRSDIRMVFAPVELETMTAALQSLPPSGRTFVLGFILHELGSSHSASQDGGHIAPIAGFSRREMYASHFFHARWSSVDPIPLKYRSLKEEGVEEFLDLAYATSVLTHSRKWADYCARNSRYTLLWSSGRFKLWARKTETTEFLSGSGNVEREGHRRLRVTLVSSEAVIKYHYLPRLRVLEVKNSRGENLPVESVSLTPFYAFDEDLGGGRTDRIDFIGLKAHSESVAVSDAAVLTVVVGDR